MGKESILITLGYHSALLKFESHAGKSCACADSVFSTDEAPERLAFCCYWLAFGSMFPVQSFHWMIVRFAAASGAFLTPQLETGQPFPRLRIFSFLAPLSAFLHLRRQERPPRINQIFSTVVDSPGRYSPLQKWDFQHESQSEWLEPVLPLNHVLNIFRHWATNFKQQESKLNRTILKQGWKVLWKTSGLIKTIKANNALGLP